MTDRVFEEAEEREGEEEDDVLEEEAAEEKEESQLDESPDFLCFNGESTVSSICF